MFNLSSYLSEPPTVKVLCFGEGKTGKTTFATDLFKLIDKGYDVIYIDCDKSINVIRNKEVKHLDKITYIPLRDEAHITIMPFINFLFSKADFWYNKVTGEVLADNRFSKDQKNLVKINGSKLDNKTIIILDSLTAFAESMFNKLREKQGYLAGSFDKDKLYNGQVQQYYGVLSVEFSEFLDRLSNLNSTVFVIAHTKTVEKKDKNGNVVERKIYPLSTTINSSESLSKYFDECIYFTARAGNYYCTTAPSTEVCGVGGRQLEPKQYSQKELSACGILSKYGHKLDGSGNFYHIGLIEDQTQGAATSQKVALTTNQIKL